MSESAIQISSDHDAPIVQSWTLLPWVLIVVAILLGWTVFRLFVHFLPSLSYVSAMGAAFALVLLCLVWLNRLVSSRR